MTEDAPAAAADPVATPTKESLLERIETLLESDEAAVIAWVHEALTFAEGLFAGKPNAAEATTDTATTSTTATPAA